MPNNYQRLGAKTYWLFALERAKAAGISSVIAIILLVAKNNISGEIVNALLGKGLMIAFGITFLALLIALASAWAEYSSYRYALDESGLKIMRGIISKEELAIPYRQIQSVDIQRDPLEQILGLSRLVILTAGQEDEHDKSQGESEGVLPAIDNDLAHRLREELLSKANVEQVTIKQ